MANEATVEAVHWIPPASISPAPLEYSCGACDDAAPQPDATADASLVTCPTCRAATDDWAEYACAAVRAVAAGLDDEQVATIAYRAGELAYAAGLTCEHVLGSVIELRRAANALAWSALVDGWYDTVEAAAMARATGPSPAAPISAASIMAEVAPAKQRQAIPVVLVEVA